MKRVLLLFLIGLSAVHVYAAVNNRPPSTQPFSAVFWKTITLHSRSGTPSIFMQRTVCTRDESANMRCEVYRPTKGLNHDTTTPVERVVVGPNSPHGLPRVQFAKESIAEDVDLGTTPFSGVSAAGRRQTFRDATGKWTHTVETWFSSSLGLTVHMETRNTRGDTVVSDLSELNMSKTDSTAPTPEAVTPAIPLLNLYRGLFTLISHMERDRQAGEPSNHVNMQEIEDHLRNNIGLSETQWRALVDESTKVDAYTRETLEQARNARVQDRSTLQHSSFPSITQNSLRAARHRTQLDFNAHVQGSIDELTGAIGSEAAKRIQAYLQGKFSTSISRTKVSPTQLQAWRSHKGDGQ